MPPVPLGSAEERVGVTGLVRRWVGHQSRGCGLLAWWQSLLIALGSGGLTAGVALFGVQRTIRSSDSATTQREVAAKREEWWRRFSWAAELSLDDSQRRAASGQRLLETLARSPLAEPGDLELMYAFPARVLDSIEGASLA